MNVSNDQVVITGVGLLTPLGLSREATWSAVKAGQCGLGPISAMEQELPPGSTGGQVADLPADFEPHQPREVRYLRAAIIEALTDARIEPGRTYPAERCGFMLGTTLHGMRAAGRFFRNGDDYALLSRFSSGSTLQNAASGLNMTGFSATSCSACSSSLGSIATGVALLRSGQLDVVVTGGYDTISEYVYGGFNSLRLVAPGPLRPFTRDRQGMKLAEGYGIVVLERRDDAADRGARPLATILGYGESADAHHLTQPHPQGEGAARAMKAALASAGLQSQGIDLIAAHATGTPDNDAGEYAALSRVFGEDLPLVPVVAFKSHLGHTLGAAGAVELILSALCLRDQIIPACVNIRADEIDFPGLQVATGKSRPGKLRATFNTSLGFGGANTCMILGPAPRGEASDFNIASDSLSLVRGGEGPNAQRHAAERNSKIRPSPQPSPLRTGEREPEYAPQSHVSHVRDVLITGIGVVLPGMVGNEAFARALNSVEPRRVMSDTGPIPEAEYSHLLNARRIRRMSDYVKLSLAATMLACSDAGITDIPEFGATCPALLGTAHGSANYSETYYRQIVGEGIAGANPVLFAEGVPNAAAAQLSLMLSLKGPCQTVIGTRTAGLDALHLARTRIATGEWDRAVVSAAEEFAPVVNEAYRPWGLYGATVPSMPFSGETNGFVVGCGAVTLILESASSLEKRGVKPRGKIIHSTGPVANSRFSPHRAQRIVQSLGDVKGILCSANGTWLDRVEAIALGGNRHDKIISSLAGHLAESYSVMPLAGIAAVLLNGCLPCLFKSASLSDGYPPLQKGGRFGILCSDYTGILSAASVEKSTYCF